jgi:hypothetical protein
MSHSMKANLGRRIALLEAKTKLRLISTWIDFVLWLDEHEGDDGKLEVVLSQSCRSLSKWLLPIARVCMET